MTDVLSSSSPPATIHSIKPKNNNNTADPSACTLFYPFWYQRSLLGIRNNSNNPPTPLTTTKQIDWQQSHQELLYSTETTTDRRSPASWYRRHQRPKQQLVFRRDMMIDVPVLTDLDTIRGQKQQPIDVHLLVDIDAIQGQKQQLIDNSLIKRKQEANWLQIECR